jgi:mannose-6-phosphate isomerase-like protein (cupin superfamily)
MKMTPEAFHIWRRKFHMSEPTDPHTTPGIASALLVAAGQDRFGEQRRLGINTIDYKLTSQDSTGLLIVEVTSQAKGGPERHLHVAQDEWFYVLEGQFLIEVAAERFRLTSGDAVLAPRRVPHAWANVGDGKGRLLAVLTPAGKMEAFLRDMAKTASLAPPDPALWRVYDMEWSGRHCR